MTTKVTTASEAVEEALKALLIDKVGGSNTEAYTAAMAYGLDMVENDVDDLEKVAYISAAFFDGYVQALTRK